MIRFTGWWCLTCATAGFGYAAAQDNAGWPALVAGVLLAPSFACAVDAFAEWWKRTPT